MATIQKHPMSIPRVETGVVQFGDDWPGIFIRGDDALPYAMYLEQLIHAVEETNPLGAIPLRGLVDILRSCDERKLWVKERG